MHALAQQARLLAAIHEHLDRFGQFHRGAARRLGGHGLADDAHDRIRAVVRIAAADQDGILVGKEDMQTGRVRIILQAALLAQCSLQQRLETARKGGQQLAVVGVRRFQPQRAECAGQRGDGIKYRRQAVALRQCGDAVMQADQLAREDQFAIRQLLFVERDDHIAAVGNDRRLFGTMTGFCCLAWRSASCAQSCSKPGRQYNSQWFCAGFCMRALWHRLGDWPEGGNIRACFFDCNVMSKRYDLIVFDWDGTVMDSTAVIAGSIQAACRDLGLTCPDDETARHVIGLGLDQALHYAVPDLTDAMRPDLVERYRYHFLAQDEAIPLFDGARETIAELHDAGYRLGVATGKSRTG